MKQSLKFAAPVLAVFVMGVIGMSVAVGHDVPSPQKPAAVAQAPTAEQQDMQQLAARLNDIEPQAE